MEQLISEKLAAAIAKKNKDLAFRNLVRRVDMAVYKTNLEEEVHELLTSFINEFIRGEFQLFLNRRAQASKFVSKYITSEFQNAQALIMYHWENSKKELDTARATCPTTALECMFDLEEVYVDVLHPIMNLLLSCTELTFGLNVDAKTSCDELVTDIKNNGNIDDLVSVADVISSTEEKEAGSDGKL